VCSSDLGDSGQDTIYGQDGNDFIYGGDDADQLFGMLGNDYVFGQGGDDYIAGGGGNDHVDGGDGNDRVGGDTGHDYLLGGDGDDTLFGGVGTDELTGGSGKDTFVFNRKADSLRGNPSDTITDFTVGEDRVDLSGLGIDLVYIGNAGFSGVAGEVRVKTSGGTDKVIQVDVDGDGSWDMKIVVSDVTEMGESDFIL